ncbi:N-acetylglucosamine-6-phosphate deacetylase [Helicocarpus griseus UAMH5409]|uniref:N-acetylglucosamine-6-phosphate deacetylase n=1 Tax=Helicocarpus griseus UAMH5409 TaxID=1447875 RepID=A0A2B7WTW1_9EURO|nr:N-acetylglucosamine-6-phosphate deacetylase [Helicocarpus griseus UAMH5409]
MPSISQDPQTTPRITKFTNCRLSLNGQLIEQDLWVDSSSGKILQDQQAFYEHQLCPDQVIDLGGRILAPGFIDVQLNGARGFDFSVPKETKEEYDAGLKEVNRALVRTGVTSYLPTLTSQRGWVYKKVLPSLAPSGAARRPSDGAESLGAHVEGPFLSPGKPGIHSPAVLQTAHNGLQDLIDCYGAENLFTQPATTNPPVIKMLTTAPEQPNILPLLPPLLSRNPSLILSIGHSDATYEQALAALSAGATMITHLFNAMKPFYHRNPGIFGLLGHQEEPGTQRPYYGLIADGVHLHPTSIRIAYNAHPRGMVLVTDAMMLCGMPDGVYEWTNGERIVKRGVLLMLEEAEDEEGNGENSGAAGGKKEGKIAGSSATLIECVNNFRRWAGTGIVEAVRAVTETPAEMLGVNGVKGVLEAGADADLVVLGERGERGEELTVDQVWKFGVKVFDRETDGEGMMDEESREIQGLLNRG